MLTFVVCYARIFHLIRRQNRIFPQSPQDTAAIASSSAASATVSNQKSRRSQINAVKTMILTTAFFTVSWMPSNFYAVISYLTSATIIPPLWYATEFIALFNICTNPFIYAVSCDDIRIYLSRKLVETDPLKMFRRQTVDISLPARTQTAMTTCWS